MNTYAHTDLVLKNQAFDEEKFPNRADIVQICYLCNSLLAKALRDTFSSANNIVTEFLSTRDNKKTLLNIPESKREYIVISIKDGVIHFDCLPKYSSDVTLQANDFGEEAPQRREVTTSGFVRNATVIDQAKKRANGVCQLCGQQAPFTDKHGNPYLEVHHIIWLSRGGADTLGNTVALCPNCHSKMHILDP